MSSDIIIVKAQQRALRRKLWEKVSPKRVMESVFKNTLKKQMDLIRTKDDEIRQEAAELKQHLKSGRQSLKQRRYLEFIQWITEVDKSVAFIGEAVKDLESLRQEQVDDFYGQYDPDDPDNIVDLDKMQQNFAEPVSAAQIDELMKEAGVMDWFGSQRERAAKMLEKMYSTTLRKRHGEMMKLYSRANGLVGTVLNKLKELDKARTGRDVSKYMAVLNEIRSAHVIFNREFRKTYNDHIKDIVDRLAKDRAAGTGPGGELKGKDEPGVDDNTGQQAMSKERADFEKAFSMIDPNIREQYSESAMHELERTTGVKAIGIEALLSNKLTEVREQARNEGRELTPMDIERVVKELNVRMLGQTGAPPSMPAEFQTKLPAEQVAQPAQPQPATPEGQPVSPEFAASPAWGPGRQVFPSPTEEFQRERLERSPTDVAPLPAPAAVPDIPVSEPQPELEVGPRPPEEDPQELGVHREEDEDSFNETKKYWEEIEERETKREQELLKKPTLGDPPTSEPAEIEVTDEDLEEPESGEKEPARRSVAEIAADIKEAWPNVSPKAAKHLEAMLSMKELDEKIVKKFLAAASPFRSEKATDLKNELRTLVGLKPGRASRKKVAQIASELTSPTESSDPYEEEDEGLPEGYERMLKIFRDAKESQPEEYEANVDSIYLQATGQEPLPPGWTTEQLKILLQELNEWEESFEVTLPEGLVPAMHEARQSQIRQEQISQEQKKKEEVVKPKEKPKPKDKPKKRGPRVPPVKVEKYRKKKRASENEAHTYFINQLLKHGDNPAKMVMMLCKYSELIDDINPQASKKLLNIAEGLLQKC